MEMQQEMIGDVCVLNIAGHIDAANSHDLKTHLQSLIDDNRIKMVVDLSAVAFIDSSGLGALVNGLKVATRAGGSLKICGLRAYIKDLFHTMRLDRVFELFENRPAAVDSY